MITSPRILTVQVLLIGLRGLKQPALTRAIQKCLCPVRFQAECMLRGCVLLLLTFGSHFSPIVQQSMMRFFHTPYNRQHPLGRIAITQLNQLALLSWIPVIIAVCLQQGKYFQYVKRTFLNLRRTPSSVRLRFIDRKERFCGTSA